LETNKTRTIGDSLIGRASLGRSAIPGIWSHRFWRRRASYGDRAEAVPLCEFLQGDLVECIDDAPNRAESKVMPVYGGLYTVANVRPFADGFSVRLKELTPSCYGGGPCRCGDCGWDAGRFRKVYRPKDDLIARLKAAPVLETA
jgi:hypothetical protein